MSSLTLLDRRVLAEGQRINLGQHMTAQTVGAWPEEAYRVASCDELLGLIEWYPDWKQFVFVPEYGALFSCDCMRELATFCERLTRGRRRVGDK